MPICENSRFKTKKFSTLECPMNKYSNQVVNSKKANSSTSGKQCRPKDNDFYSLITFYDSIPGML